MQLSTTDPSAHISQESLAQSAIVAALSSNWQEAIKLNEKILKGDKTNTEALNRLARAQACTGDYQKAQKTYKKVLEVDPYNIIALKNIEKLEKSGPNNIHISNGNTQTNVHSVNLSRVFLDEPGKTKLVSLLNLAPPSVLASLNCGDQLMINPKNHAISVATQSGTYLGAFPDDLAHKLIGFITGGNKYDAYVKSSTTKNLTIFVREIQRSTKFQNQPSFQNRISVFEDGN
ncbi:MAG TPA: tetratricopeptide repeat protein [Candidatus Saccharimonadales bacterium]|nr:tetratricopeptide repeat protein [Candidatus Saccharimonadales bacterium]